MEVLDARYPRKRNEEHPAHTQTAAGTGWDGKKSRIESLPTSEDGGVHRKALEEVKAKMTPNERSSHEVQRTSCDTRARSS